MTQEPFAATSTTDGYTDARLLMVAPKEGWEPADHAHAAAVLSEAAARTYGHSPFGETFGLFEQAASIFQQIGNKEGEATALDNMGSVLVYDPDLNDRPRALEIYQQALSLWLELGSRWCERFSRSEIASIACYLGRFDEAESQLIKVIALDKAVAHPDLEKDRATLDRVRAVQCSAARRQATGQNPDKVPTPLARCTARM